MLAQREEPLSFENSNAVLLLSTGRNLSEAQA